MHFENNVYSTSVSHRSSSPLPKCQPMQVPLTVPSTSKYHMLQKRWWVDEGKQAENINSRLHAATLCISTQRSAPLKLYTWRLPAHFRSLEDQDSIRFTPRVKRAFAGLQLKAATQRSWINPNQWLKKNADKYCSYLIHCFRESCLKKRTLNHEYLRWCNIEVVDAVSRCRKTP